MKKKDLGLFLGMILGDGCLPNKHNGKGYRNYMVGFYNTEKSKVILFNKLFKKITGIEGKLKKRIRAGRKPLYQVEKYSKKAFDMINQTWEIPDGKKAKKAFIPSFIKNGRRVIKKHFFLGLLITDGYILEKIKQ